MNYQIFSANEWIYPDQKIASDGKKAIQAVVAQNSFACAQILVENVQNEFRWQFVFEQEQVTDGPELYHLIPVYVEKNTGIKGFTIPAGEKADYVTRTAPFWVYDAMQPVEKNFTETSSVTSTGLYVRWPVGYRKPGIYRGVLHLYQGLDHAEIPVEYNVMDVEVPKIETLRLTNWFSIENMASYHEVEPWSEAHWNMIEEYGRLMREGRQTDFLVPSGLMEYTRRDDGTYEFNYTRMKRFIDLYLGLGFRYINGGTPIFREDWANSFFTVTIHGKNYPAMSEEAYAFLLSYFRSWYTFLCENGWDSITIQHVGDEPHADCALEYRILSGIVRKCVPNIPLIDAVEIPALDGAVDIWVPKNNTLTEHWEAFEQKRMLGDTIWFYTCCCPGGHYLNRFLDGALLRTRYLHWANFLYNLPGYLHWGLNHYECTDDPFSGHAGSINSLSITALPCGDSHIVYPLGKQVLRSVRFEAMRAGCEDYEILRLLEEKDKEQVDTIVKSGVQSFTQYNEDADQFDAVYCRLLEKL